LAQNTSNKHRMVTIHPPARLVGEPKKIDDIHGMARKHLCCCGNSLCIFGSI